MKSFSIIEDLNVVEDIRAKMFQALPFVPIDKFSFERGKETFGYRIVPAVSAPTHAARAFRCSQEFLVPVSGVLASAI